MRWSDNIRFGKEKAMKICFIGNAGNILLEDMVEYKTVDEYLLYVVKALEIDAEYKNETDESKKSTYELFIKMAPAPQFIPLKCTIFLNGLSYEIIKNGVPVPHADEIIKEVKAYWERQNNPYALEFGSDEMSIEGNSAEKELFFTIE